MKKSLLFIFMLIGIAYMANAQAIEVIGSGVLSVDSKTLYFNEPSSIDHVVVEATAIFWGKSATPGPVRFHESGLNAEDYTVNFIRTEQNYSSLQNPGDGHWGYYTATFNDVDAGGITLDKMAKGDSIKSFIAYIYRDNSPPEIMSWRKNDHSLMWLNSSENPLTYNFVLPITTGTKDIEVTVPFTDLASQRLRWAIVTVTAGTESVTSEFQTNNMGALLRLEKLELEDVPADVTNVEVKIYSPLESIDGKEGDSFITGAVLLTSTEQREGCTYTQGYWKTHSVYGPASKPNPTWDLLLNGPDTEFFLSEQTWYEVFNTSVSGNAYYQLAHQYMAAYLNMQNGTMLPNEVAEALSAAELIFEAQVPNYFQKIKGKSEATKSEISALTTLASTLARYNEGFIGPGHCDEFEEDFMIKSAEINNNVENNNLNNLTVYPNPTKHSATIQFSTNNDKRVTIDIYNLMGQKTLHLFEGNVRKDIPVSISLDSHKLNEGIYIITVNDGYSIECTRFGVSR